MISVPFHPIPPPTKTIIFVGDINLYLNIYPKTRQAETFIETIEDGEQENDKIGVMIYMELCT